MLNKTCWTRSRRAYNVATAITWGPFVFGTRPGNVHGERLDEWTGRRPPLRFAPSIYYYYYSVSLVLHAGSSDHLLNTPHASL